MVSLPHNIERSRFRSREYVAWDCDGNRYRVRKNGPRKERGSWWVYPDDSKCIPLFYADTLALVSLHLEQRSAESEMMLRGGKVWQRRCLKPGSQWRPPSIWDADAERDAENAARRADAAEGFED